MRTKAKCSRKEIVVNKQNSSKENLFQVKIKHLRKVQVVYFKNKKTCCKNEKNVPRIIQNISGKETVEKMYTNIFNCDTILLQIYLQQQGFGPNGSQHQQPGRGHDGFHTQSRRVVGDRSFQQELGHAGPQRQQQFVPVTVGRDKAESSQQGADRGAQQQQTEQGALKKKRPFCFRCKSNGHINENCKADLDCIICNKKNSHLAAKCPILKMPKPNASFFGSRKKEFAFIRITDVDYNLEAPDPAPTGLVTVTGGRLTAEVVQSELACITRADWKWEALPHDEESFLVAFPSDDSLQSMVDIGYHLKNHGVTLTVSVWQNNHDIIPKYELEDVWVHITGVPHAYRHYLVFWAVGTVIGATLEVDMLTYRKKGVIRVKVRMLDKSQLPHTTDLVFGTEGYLVTFTREDELFLPATVPPEDNDPMDQDDLGDGDGNTEDFEREALSKKIEKL